MSMIDLNIINLFIPSEITMAAAIHSG